MPIDKESQRSVEVYHKKMLCVNKEDLNLSGNWNSDEANLMNLQLRKCTNRADCKSEQEILEFF